MKKILTLIAMVAISATMFGQAPKVEDKVASLEGDVKVLKEQMTSVQSRLNELADRNAEYKKALDIKQILNVNDTEGFQYGIVSAIGNKEEGTIVLTLSVFNTGESRERHFKNAQLTDYNGNGSDSWSYTYGSMGPYVNIDSNTSLKVQFTFKDVTPETKRIASLTINTSNQFGKVMSSLNFRDIPVEWK